MSVIKQAIAKLIGGASLSLEESETVAREIMEGEATPAQIASFLTALRLRGEKREHIVGFARIMREKAEKVSAPPDTTVLDTCGTGGDEKGTFNISTGAAFVAAAAGARVAKHGNRSVSSRCGSADVMEALGVRIDVPPSLSQKCLQEIGICFLFAPLYHKAMKHAIGPRREIGIRTIFNMVGPLSNPASATHQLIGVFSPEVTELFAEVLRDLGTRRALVVHGHDGLDEITTTTVTTYAELYANGEIAVHTLDPTKCDIPLTEISELVAGEDAEHNAAIIESVLRGAPGPRTDIVLLNAGAALYVSELADSIYEGVERAREAIRSGAALDKLNELRKLTQSHATTD